MSTPAAHLVAVGAAAAGEDEQVMAVVAALEAAGLPVTSRTLVEEDEGALEAAFGTTASLTVVLGGAGGAADLVRRVLAHVAGVSLALSERMLAAFQDAARRRGQPLSRGVEGLAILPQGATVWVEPGVEPAWMVDLGGRAVAVLPRGVETATIVERHLLPLARSVGAGRGALTRTLRTVGLTLAEVEQRLTEQLRSAAPVETTILPAAGEVWVRLRAQPAAGAAEALAGVEATVRAILGVDCYGRDDESLEQVVGRLLMERALTLSVAESCTGGLLGHRLTSVPGSSAYFERGVMVYSNRAKQELLGVPEAVLGAHGAVSAPCAEAMARGIREASGSGCALSVTGIAGPDGGTPHKPVGTVFVGIAVGSDVDSRRFLFSGGRSSVKWQSAQAALDLLRRHLLRM